jgi:hypothetical protein
MPSRSRGLPLVLIVLSVLLGLAKTNAVRAQSLDERLVGTGAIAGQPATFILDTGVQQPFVITEAGAKRFGLEADRKPPPAAVLFEAISKPVQAVLPGGHGLQVSFAILKQSDAPEYGGDAIIGWPVLKAYVTHYDKQHQLLAVGPNLQPRLANARSFPILPDYDLALNAGSREKPLAVFVDTGWSGGVLLSKPLWEEWRRRNRNLPYTYSSTYWYDTGDVVLEQVLAKEIRLGSLSLKNVLVSPLPSGLTSRAAMIGLKAFANHALVIDGPAGLVVIDGPGKSLMVPAYNRLGAIFWPSKTARVAHDSPAAQADVREGDVLIAINGQTPEAYVTAVEGNVWEQPAGTAVRLTIRRGPETIERQVTLRDFLSRNR